MRFFLLFFFFCAGIFALMLITVSLGAEMAQLRKADYGPTKEFCRLTTDDGHTLLYKQIVAAIRSSHKLPDIPAVNELLEGYLLGKARNKHDDYENTAGTEPVKEVCPLTLLKAIRWAADIPDAATDAELVEQLDALDDALAQLSKPEQKQWKKIKVSSLNKAKASIEDCINKRNGDQQSGGEPENAA